jgi:para-nitrobenzyl esterase
MNFSKILGIPYAVPPVGNLRWQPSQLLTGPNCWEGILNASDFGSRCNQFLDVGSEDCLFLNIWVPRSQLNSSNLLPVMFYIHGGFVLV